MTSIILIEDDEDFGPLLLASLEETGHAVRLYTNTVDALEGYKKSPAEVIVTDVIIRENGRVVADGGITAIWKIKQEAAKTDQSVAVIAISGAHYMIGMESILSTAQSIGADAVLEKPFAEEELMETIASVLHTA